MKKMRYADAIIDRYNAIVGAIVAVLSYILGEHWLLFVAFLLLNVAVILGYSNINTTMTYVYSNLENVKSAYKKYSM